jgi:hypothetical protein
MDAVIHAVCLHDLGISQNPHKVNLPVEDDGIRYKCGKWIAVKGTEARQCKVSVGEVGGERE